MAKSDIAKAFDKKDDEKKASASEKPSEKKPGAASEISLAAAAPVEAPKQTKPKTPGIDRSIPAKYRKFS